MTRLIAISLFFMLASCTTPSAPNTEAKPIATVAESPYYTEPYTIQIEIVQAADQTRSLLVSMDLAPGSHFVSPYSSGGFSGRFGVYLDENPHLKLEGGFVETPRSVEEFDAHPYTNRFVNWVRIDTRYAYGLIVASDEDFEVAGLVSFTIEPRCTFEKVRFVVAQKDGELMVRR